MISRICTKLTKDDNEFILSLSSESRYMFSQVKLLYQELSRDKDLTIKLMDIWNKTGAYPSAYINILNK